jgi:hypothetical protein
VVHVAYMRHSIRCRQYVNMNTDHDEIRCDLDGFIWFVSESGGILL